MSLPLILPPERILDIRDLSVSFGRGSTAFNAVQVLDLYVDRGETLAIVGESGSGKSVTSLAIMRLVEFGGGRIDSGNIFFKGARTDAIDLRLQSEQEMRRLRGAEIGMIFRNR